MNRKLQGYLILILIFLMSCEDQNTSQSHDLNTENLFLITIDGFRWQEVFSGADSSLIRREEFVEEVDSLVAAFWRETAEERRQTLMPFFWELFGSHGQIYGNPNLNSNVALSNKIGYSYPGYSEILVGFADDRIKGNAKIWNPNKNVLEFINEQPGFRGKVAVFGSWDAFSYIVNSQRSGIPVNTGFAQAEGPDLTPREEFLNELITAVPSPWSNVRLDAFTHHYALEYLRKKIRACYMWLMVKQMTLPMMDVTMPICDLLIKLICLSKDCSTSFNLTTSTREKPQLSLLQIMDEAATQLRIGNATT